MLKISIRMLTIAALIAGSSAFAAGVEDSKDKSTKSIEQVALEKEVVDAAEHPEKPLKVESMLKMTRYLNKSQIEAAKDVKVNDNLMNSEMLDLKGSNADLMGEARVLSSKGKEANLAKITEVLTKAHSSAQADLQDPAKAQVALKRIALEKVLARQLIVSGMLFDNMDGLEAKTLIDAIGVYNENAERTLDGFYLHMNLAKAASIIRGEKMTDSQAMDKGEDNYLKSIGYKTRAQIDAKKKEINPCTGIKVKAAGA